MFLINKDLNHLIITAYPYTHWPHTWHAIIKIIEHCKQEIRICQVKWGTPHVNTLKLNTDSSTLNNPPKIRGGGILRVHSGRLMYVFSIPLGEGTNNQS